MNATTLTNLPPRVKICEVGPRDGLQNEAAAVSAADKIRYINLLSEAGLPIVEATSFVSPKAIPQLADAAEVYAGIRKQPGVTYLVLVPNLKGLERARAAGVQAIALFTAASETFTKRNINATIDESLAAFTPVATQARREGMWVRGYISTAFGCPYEGDVPQRTVVDIAERLADMGIDEISVGDTIGVGTPDQVAELTAALQERLPIERLAMHFHDTRGTALANVSAALQMGVTIFDASSGGMGGCPYAPGASGNLSTEDLLYLLHHMHIETGVDLDKVRAATRFITGVLGHPPASRVYAAMEAAAAAAKP